MSDRVIDNPIINSPYGAPHRHFAFDREGITNTVLDGRRPSTYFVPVPKPRKRGQQLALLDLTQDDIRENTQVNQIRRRVDLWRLRAYPDVTPATRRLLEYWSDPGRDNPIFFCQREAAETAIYLAEAAAKQGDVWIRNALDEINTEHNGKINRQALKMATGSGKTVVMAMLIAWQTINKAMSPKDGRFARRFLIVTPGLTIRDRLRVLLPEDSDNYYRMRDLVPPEFASALGQAQIVITNFHSFLLRETREGKNVSGMTKAILADGSPTGSPFTETLPQMVARVCRQLGGSSEVVVLNDEAHHCYRGKLEAPDEYADTVASLVGEEKKDAKTRNEDARVWFAGLEAVHAKFGIKTVYDLSATPFFLAGSGYREGTLFPWVVSDFSLIDAIESGIVKIPRVPVDDNRVSTRVAYLNLWEDVRHHLPKGGRSSGTEFSAENLPDQLRFALESLYGSYQKAFAAWESSTSARHGEPPPVFIVVCSNTSVSKAVFDYIAGRERTVGGKAVLVPGKLDQFSNVEGGRWLHRPRTVLVDAYELESGVGMSKEFRVAAKHEIEEFKSDYVRRFPGRSTDDISDSELMREVMNTVGKRGKLGEGVRCVVSVSMLTEGWDANTVTHILGVRAFGTQLLCEQVVGRGLRRRSYVADEDGMFAPEYADVYGVPFQFIPTVGKTRELTLKPTRHVRAEPDRAGLAITFPRLVGYRLEMPDEPLSADLKRDDVRMVLTKAAVPTETVMAGIVGSEETHTLEDLRKRREQEIVYALAADILERKLCIDGQPRPWYFPQLVPIVREWMARCVTYHDDAFPGMLLLRDQEATDRIWQAVTSEQGKRSSFVFPVLRPFHPIGTTAGVDFHTTKAVYPTAEDRCHINFVTLDGDDGNAWERAVAQALEGLPKIAAYAKNDRLDFVIPYEHLGRSHRYVPDFLAQLVDIGDGVRRKLVIEVSGTRKDPSQTATKAATARHMWVPAVNNHGGWGLWGYCEIRDPTRAKLDINAAIDELTNYRPPNVLADVSL